MLLVVRRMYWALLVSGGGIIVSGPSDELGAIGFLVEGLIVSGPSDELGAERNIILKLVVNKICNHLYLFELL